MQIRYHDQFKKITDSPATSVVIYDDMGNPLVVVVEQRSGQQVISTVLDPDFNQTLRNYGFDRTIRVSEAS